MSVLPILDRHLAPMHRASDQKAARSHWLTFVVKLLSRHFKSCVADIAVRAITVLMAATVVFAEAVPFQSQMISSSAFVSSIEVDREGVVWIACENDGLYRGVLRADAKDIDEGMRVKEVSARAAFRLSTPLDGGILVGGASDGVLAILTGGQIRKLGLSEGILGEHVFAFASKRQDGHFILTNKACHHFDRKANTLTKSTIEGDLPDKNICLLAISEANRVLFYTCDNRLYDGHFTPQKGVISKVVEIECGPLVTAITYNESKRHFLAATARGLLVIKEGAVISRLAAKSKVGEASEKSEKLRAQRLLSGNYISAMRYDPVRDFVCLGYRECSILDVIRLDAVGTARVAAFPLGEKVDYVTSLGVAERHILVGSYGSGLSLIHLDPSPVAKQSVPALDIAVGAEEGSRLLQPPPFTAWTVDAPDLAKLIDLSQESLSTAGTSAQGAGSVYALCEDWSTSGTWLGRYGRHWICLCAHNAPYDFQWGSSPSKVKYTAQIGSNRSDGDSIRYWVHTLYTGDDRALEIPRIKLDSETVTKDKGTRRQSEWDDHGETYDLAHDGPHVFCTLEIPPGQFVLSLYNTNKDGHSGMNRIRDYRLFIRSYDERKMGPIGESLELKNFSKITSTPILAKSRFNDFWFGVWKRFAVVGPCQLVVEVNRNNSFNTLLAAVALDEMDPFPAPYFNQKFIRSELGPEDPASDLAGDHSADLAGLIKIYHGLEKQRKNDLGAWRNSVSSICAGALTIGRGIVIKPQDPSFRRYSLIMAAFSYYLGLFRDYERFLSEAGMKSPREIELLVPRRGVDEGTSQSGFGCSIIAGVIADLSRDRETGRQFTEPLPTPPKILGGATR